MNNSQIPKGILTEVEVDRKPELRQRESELIKILESIKSVADSKEWSTLKTIVFDGVVETLERQLKTEAMKDKPDTLVLAKINGQLVWAKKYADFDSLGDAFRLELSNIRKQLYGKTQETTGIR